MRGWGARAMMRPSLSGRRRLAAVLLVLGAAGEASGQSPEGPDRDFVETAVAQHIRGLYPSQRLGFQDVETSFSSGRASQGSRSTERITNLLVVLSARISIPPFCPAADREHCPEVVIRIGPPAIVGDSATVWAYAYEVSAREMIDRELLFLRTRAGWQFERTLTEHFVHSIRPPPDPGVTLGSNCW